jgi:hypothetical protein
MDVCHENIVIAAIGLFPDNIINMFFAEYPAWIAG